MHILLFCYEFPPVGGGAGHAAYALAREWVRLGHDVTVVTSGFEGLASEEAVEGIRVLRLAVGRKTLHQARILEMLRFMLATVLSTDRLFRDVKPDLSVGFMTVPSGLGPVILKWKHRVPFVTELRGGDVPGFDPAKLKCYHSVTRPVILEIWKRSQALIANSDGLARLARQALPNAQVWVIPNGVDTGRFRPVANKSRTGSAGTAEEEGAVLRLLFVGRWSESQKNISMILRVLKGLPEARLTLVGDGPDRRRVREKISEYALGGRVVTPGWLRGKALVRAYQDADLYVSASRWEGMPNTALEAMASGLPLILSDVAGHEELVRAGKNGYLFDVGDDAAMRRSILRCAVGAEREAMSRQSRRMVEEGHDWARLAREHLKIFQRGSGVTP